MSILTACVACITAAKLVIYSYMRPGQPHFVVSLNDCLAVGGHFYTSTNYESTLRGLITERFAGRMVTNTEHTTCPIVLFKLMDAHALTWRTYPDLPLHCTYAGLYMESSRLIYIVREIPELSTTSGSTYYLGIHG